MHGTVDALKRSTTPRWKKFSLFFSSLARRGMGLTPGEDEASPHFFSSLEEREQQHMSKRVPQLEKTLAAIVQDSSLLRAHSFRALDSWCFLTVTLPSHRELTFECKVTRGLTQVGVRTSCCSAMPSMGAGAEGLSPREVCSSCGRALPEAFSGRFTPSWRDGGYSAVLERFAKELPELCEAAGVDPLTAQLVAADLLPCAEALQQLAASYTIEELIDELEGL